MLSIGDKIPEGYRLATVDDVTNCREEACAAVSLEWAICFLEDGKLEGPGYKHNVESGSFPDLKHKLVVGKSI